MCKVTVEPIKVLSLFFNSRGFGYAVMKNPLELIEAKQIQTKPIDNKKLMSIARALVYLHEPTTIVLESYKGKLAKRSERIINLQKQFLRWSKRKGHVVKLYTRENIRYVFQRWQGTTKMEIIDIITRNIEQLKPLRYEKPAKYAKVHYREGLFDAVAISITHFFLTDTDMI